MKKTPKAPRSGLLLSLLGCLALAAPVSAQEEARAEAQAETEEDGQPSVDSGFYLETSGGSTRSLDQDSSFRTVFGGVSGDVDFKTGYQFGGALGYRINQIRFELAAQYRSQEVEAITGGGVLMPVGGDLDVVTGFFDVIYDFDLGAPVTPYLGAGIGVARLDMKVTQEKATPAFHVDDVVNEFGWNVLAGISLAIAPGTELILGYRRVQLFDEASFDAGTPGVSSGDFEMDYSGNEFSGGLRYTF